MTTKTKRIKAPVILTREEFELLVERVAIHSTRLREIETARDDAIQTVQQSFAPEISRLTQYIQGDVALCEKYADEHRAALLPGKTKSAETQMARFGFRLGNPTLKTLSKWTWEKVIDALDRFQITDCIRVKREVDKEAILCKGHDGAIDGWLSARQIAIPLGEIGVRIVQAETFFIEPKVDGAEQVKAGGAL